MKTKNELRNELKSRRNALDPAEQISASDSLVDHISHQPFFGDADSVLIYSPIRNEISLIPLFEICRDLKKSVYFPKTYKDNRMEFFRISSFEQLHPGAFSVMEPDGKTDRFLQQEGIVFVPALAFSKSKHRIGYGKGFYDRYLKEHPNLYKIGVGYHFQMDQEFEESDLDIPMNELFSEYGKE